MPQARRKTPFSGKAKKQQLQGKKQNKTLLMNTGGGTTAYDVVSVNYQPSRGRGGGRDTNRYALKFYRETEDELRMKKEDALKELRPVPEKALEVNPEDYFPTDLSFPKRPPWDFSMTPAQLDAQEQRYFKNYVDTLQASEHWKQMSYFELNLETWRQLWRVLEMCDVLLLIVDVRYAGMMFPPSLYSYIRAQNKDMILVLNKIELVSASVVAPGSSGMMFPPSLYTYIRAQKKDMALVLNKIELVSASVVAPGSRHDVPPSLYSYIRGQNKDMILVLNKIELGKMFPPSLYSYIRAQNKDMILVLNKIDLVNTSVGMMFPPSLYSYIRAQNKDMILVLNKIDLVTASVVAAWKEYLTAEYPELKVLYFTSCPAYNLRGATSDKAGLQVRRRKGKQRMCAEGATKILEACKEIVKGEVDLSSWEKKIKDETNVEFDYDEGAEIGETILEKADTTFYTHERYKSGVLTIGCVGQPNVGKSSLLNALMGRCVVSVSRTPGHTKHFQTIYLTPQVRLCDCPGLVFPSTVPRPIQILMGSYPIAQLREPYTTIRYLAERLDLPKLLRIEHPEGDDAWSPRDICDGWAKKRNYMTAKAARLDTYRAANSLLRMALDGRICLWLRPPGFTENKEKYETCEEIKYIRWVQALSSDDKTEDVLTSESDEERQSDTNDECSDSSDEEETTAMANKFAALAGDGDD
ncbi:hypothetical protein PYW07_012740 [Mythimna separata]|uniref:Guanine nucleotide-binding protein-like 1 n=1 Tax=Mythimna separata TaxID=271217 RepID=A0AAD7Y8S7_MYTSE|nr:hypothetical protein PYW07_012740 [Mythimna separata]